MEPGKIEADVLDSQSVRAIAYLKSQQTEQASAQITQRLYHAFERAKHQSIFAVIVGYNCYRLGVYRNFGIKSMAELNAMLHNIYGIRVPKEYFYPDRYMPIVILPENVMDFFIDKERFK